MQDTTQPNVTSLLRHSDWLDALAAKLVRDPARAADAVQDTWLAAVKRPPGDDSNPQGWLGRALKSSIAKQHRTDVRRTDREALVAATDEAADPMAELAGQLETQAQVANHVLSLDAIYRDVLMLRFWEGCSVRAAAKKLGVPVNTVRSRQARALAALREKLDAEYGERRAWAAALMPFARRAATKALWTGGAWIGGSGLAAAAVVAGALVVPNPEGPAPEPPAVAVAALDGEIQSTPAPASGPEAIENAVEDTPERVPAVEDGPQVADPVLPDAFAALTDGDALLVDLTGAPLDALYVRPATVDGARWQGGDPGWISGPGGSAFIDELTAAELAADRAAALERFGKSKGTHEWMLTVANVPLPLELREGGDTTGADGRFDIAPGAAELEVAEPDWMAVCNADFLTADGGRARVVVAAPRWDLRGRIEDLDGTPVEGEARYRVDLEALLAGLPVVLADAEAVESQRLNVFGGALLLRDVPATPFTRVEIDSETSADASSALPAGERLPLDLVLEPLGARELQRLSGLVLNAVGEAVVGASVRFGEGATATDENGAFTLAFHQQPADAPLTVIADGFAPLQREGLGSEFGEPGAELADLVLELDGAPRSISGTVYGEDGLPLAGARLELEDPSRLSISFTSVEARAAYRDAPVVSGADGSFEIGGLSPRSYRIRAWMPGTGVTAVSSAIEAGTRAVALRPYDAVRPASGRVLGPDGRGRAGVTLTVQFATFLTRSGDGGLFETGRSVTTDADGSFDLGEIAAADAALLLTDPELGTRLVPTADLAEGELELTLREATWLDVRVEGDSAVDGLQVLDATGRALLVRRAGSRASGIGPIRPVDGRFGPLEIPKSSVTLVLFEGDLERERRPLDAGGLGLEFVLVCD